MIRLTNLYGEVNLVNCSKIAYVETMRNRTRVCFNDGVFLDVKETVEEIESKLFFVIAYDTRQTVHDERLKELVGILKAGFAESQIKTDDPLYCQRMCSMVVDKLVEIVGV